VSGFTAFGPFGGSSRLAAVVLCWRHREGAEPVTTQVVRYQLDDSTVVGFEIEPGPGFHQAGTREFVGQVRKAVGPAVEAAKAVLEKVKEIKSDGVEVKFGVKVTGEASWVVAKAATEGSFEITLTWSGDSGQPAGAVS
jgi:Trypsin-co-occurring domain 1